MNHLPFEDWLLEESPLTPPQKRLLEAHLRECPSCAALAEVSLALQSARLVPPPSGFVNRFRQRLAARQQTQRRQFILGFALLILTVLGVMVGLSWPLLSSFLANPSRALLEWVLRLVAVCTTIQTWLATIGVLVRVGASLISPAIWTVTFLFLSLVCLFGIASLARLTRIPQGVRL